MVEHSKAKRAKSASVNVGAQKIGAIYAQAFLDAAEAAKKSEALIGELDSVTGALDAFPKLEAVLASALVSHEEKSRILDRVFASKLTPLTLDFLKVVSRHGRLDIVRAIVHEIEELYDELRGRVRVELRTAAPLGDGLEQKLSATLQKFLGRQPQLEGVVDPDVIGGVVLRVGDTVYDGSVAWQLSHVREQMITRSVHEIQSRRDRFRHSGGN